MEGGCNDWWGKLLFYIASDLVKGLQRKICGCRRRCTRLVILVRTCMKEDMNNHPRT